MDLLKIVLDTLKRNIPLAIVLVLLALASGISHYYLQSYSYVSNFKTNNGGVDYALFKSLTDFENISGDVYDLPEDELSTYIEALADFRISFIEETTSSISFTLVTNEKDKDHSVVQAYILKLINNNQFIKNSQISEQRILEKKLAFLSKRINQLDSLMVVPSETISISGIPSDAYDLYSEQVDLEEEFTLKGKFELFKPITEVATNKKPIVLFVILYFILAGFLFLFFSKKVNTSEG